MPEPLTLNEWPYLPVLSRLLLALGIGVFVGLERERRDKEAGVRTFAFAALLGCVGALLGQGYALLALSLLGILVFFLNWQRMREDGTVELTTSAAFLTVGFTGALCGLGHTFTPVAVGIATGSLLAWKETLKGFSVGLTEKEIRAALLLAIIAFVVYPVLPAAPLDPWGLIHPRAAWGTVILVAAVGFVNYILYKLLGSRGLEVSGFLGGLVNSTVTTTELSTRTKEAGDSLVPIAYRGIVAANLAMLVRNGILMGILSIRVLPYLLSPLVLMILAGGVALWRGRKTEDAAETPALTLESPFSLPGALKFGLIFLVLDVAATVAQRYLGPVGFYAVSLAGGVVSSASAVASAATLATQGKLPLHVAAIGALLAVIASLLVNVPLTARISGSRTLARKVAVALGAVTVVGIIAMAGQALLRGTLMR